MSLSAADVKYELESLRPNLFLDETEDTWEKIGKSITSFIKLCERGGYDANPSEFVTVLRASNRPIVSAMNSERTRLSLNALEFISALASAMGGELEQLLPLFMQPLLALCTRTNKVVLNRSRACIFAIIESSQSASLLTYFLQNIKDKSNTLKVVASEGTLACLNSCNPPDLEKESRAIEIEAIIRCTARDAHADVRKVSRKLFESYKILLPSRVSNFTGPLSPTTKKYLDIKAATVQPKPVSNTRSTGQINKPQTKPEARISKPSASASTTSTSHVPSRSVSATLSTTATTHPTRQPVTAMTRVSRKDPTEAPASSYAPVRPVQPARVVADAQTTNVQRRVATGGPMRSNVSEDHKRPAPPMRSQSSTTTRTGAGAASSTGANRLQLNSAAPVATASGSQSTFSGPRRVPMPAPAPILAPEPAPAPPKDKERPRDKESLKPPVPKASSAASFKPRPAAAAPPAPVKIKPASTLPSTKERFPAATATQTRVRPASAAAHNAAASSTASSSTTTRPLVVAKAKPQWGRSAAPAKPVPVPQKATTLVRKPSSRVLPRVAAPVKKRPVTPAMVALPPSPTPDDNKADVEDAVEVLATTAEQPQEEQNKEDVAEERQTTPSLSQVEEPQEQRQDEELVAAPVVSVESVPVSDGHPEKREEDDGRASPSTVDNSQGASTIPTPSTGGPQTPHGLLPLPPSTQAAFAAKTPISALLSSIERGFTYSPNTPLSPAELYLPNDNGATPYSHQSHAHAQGPRQPFNYALHAPDAGGVFAGFAFGAKKEEELVCGDIGVIKVSDHNKLFSQIGLDDATARHAFIELNQ